MSWSISASGTPDAVAEKLEAHSQTLTGQSRQEYDEAKPHLVGLVKQNAGDPAPTISLSANGHATFKDGKKQSGTCRVQIG